MKGELLAHVVAGAGRLLLGRGLQLQAEGQRPAGVPAARLRCAASLGAVDREQRQDRQRRRRQASVLYTSDTCPSRYITCLVRNVVLCQVVFAGLAVEEGASQPEIFSTMLRKFARHAAATDLRNNAVGTSDWFSMHTFMRWEAARTGSCCAAGPPSFGLPGPRFLQSSHLRSKQGLVTPGTTRGGENTTLQRLSSHL